MFFRSPHPLGGNPFAQYAVDPFFGAQQAPDYEPAAPARRSRHTSSPQQMFTLDPFGRLVPVEVQQHSNRRSGHRTPPAPRTYEPQAHHYPRGRSHGGSPTPGCRQGYGYAPRHAHQVAQDDELQALMSHLEQLERQGRAPGGQGRPSRYADTYDQYGDQEDYEYESGDDSCAEEASQTQPQPPYAPQQDMLSSLFGALAPYAGGIPQPSKRRVAQQVGPRPTPLRTTPIVTPKTPRHNPPGAEQMPFAVPSEHLAQPHSRSLLRPQHLHTRSASPADELPSATATATAHAVAGHQQPEHSQLNSAAKLSQPRAGHASDAGQSVGSATAAATATAAAAAQPHRSHHDLSKSQAARIIQARWRGWAVRRDHGTLRALVREHGHIQAAEDRLAQLMEDTQGNITHKHCLEVQELAMRALLALDACASTSDDVRAVRKRLTKRALALQDKVADVYQASSHNIVRQRSMVVVVPTVAVETAAADHPASPAGTVASADHAETKAAAADSTPAVDGTVTTGSEQEPALVTMLSAASSLPTEATASDEQPAVDQADIAKSECSAAATETGAAISAVADDLPTDNTPTHALSAAAPPVTALSITTLPALVAAAATEPVSTTPTAAAPQPAEVVVAAGSTPAVTETPDISTAATAPSPAVPHTRMFSPFKAVQESSQLLSSASSMAEGASKELLGSASQTAAGGDSSGIVEQPAQPAARSTESATPASEAAAPTAPGSNSCDSSAWPADQAMATPQPDAASDSKPEPQRCAPEQEPATLAQEPGAPDALGVEAADSGSVPQHAVEPSTTSAGSVPAQESQQEEQERPQQSAQEWEVLERAPSDGSHTLVSHLSAASHETVSVGVQTETSADVSSLSPTASTVAAPGAGGGRRGVRVGPKASSAAQTRMLRQLLQLAQSSGLLQAANKPRRVGRGEAACEQGSS